MLTRVALSFLLIGALQSEGAAAADPVADCHRLAANPSDAGHIGEGVPFNAIDARSAITACLQAVEANPKDGRLAYQLGRAYDSAKNFSAAENAYLRAVDLGFDLAKRNLGYLYQEGSNGAPDPKKAERWFRAAAKDGDTDAMNALAWMWVTAGEKLKQAAELSRRAVDAEPGEADYHDTLGWILYRRGEHAEAASEAERAIGIAPDNASFHAHLGWIYSALGREDVARREWQRALDLPPPDPVEDPTFDRPAMEEKLKETG